MLRYVHESQNHHYCTVIPLIGKLLNIPLLWCCLVVLFFLSILDLALSGVKGLKFSESISKYLRNSAVSWIKGLK